MTVSMRTHQAWLARSGAAVVLSLQTLKDQVRTRWDAICTPTGASLERLFRAKLGPSDRFARIDELNWLVVMPDTSIEDALSCCLRIAYELHRAVMPTCELEQLKVSSAATVGADLLELTPLSDEQLRVAGRRAGLDALVNAMPEPLADVADVPRRFEPVWDSKHGIVSGYRCLPDGGPGDTVGQQLKHTQAMLAGMSRLLNHPLNGRCNIFVPVPYDVLSAPPARMEFLSSCRALKCELRPSMVFEIATLAAGIPKHRLAEIVSAIQPFARAVIARSAPRNRSLKDYGGTGLKALGFDLTGSHADESDICRLCEAGKRLGMPSYFGNVLSERTLDQAVTLGAQWISGPAIGAPVNEPAPPVRLTMDAILQSLQQPMGAVG